MADMKPEHLGETLSAYLDGELDAAKTAQIEQVLRDSPSARDQLNILRGTVELLGALPRHDAPETLAEDLQAYLERSELVGGLAEPTTTPARRRTPLLAILSTAAALAFVAGGMWFMAMDAPGTAEVGPSALQSSRARDVRDARLADADTPDERRSESSARELLASATLEQKLAAGLDVTTVRTHVFANEPVRLQLASTDARAQRAITSRLLSRLKKMDLINVASAPESRSTGDAKIAGLYYRGAAHQNFGEGGGFDHGFVVSRFFENRL